MSRFAPYAKAIVAAVVAGLAAIATGLEDGGISAQEAIYAAIAFLVGLGAVFAVPNAKPEPEPQRPRRPARKPTTYEKPED